MSDISNSLVNATGLIPYGLTNDCMFHFVFQKDMVALKGLLCSVLHLEQEDIKEIEVCNPIEIGKSFDSKDFYLDLKIKFNNNTIVNLEMQILNRGNWPERSLSYLCRSFDNLNKGNDYRNVLSAIHIGFIDFTLFPNEPEFCATYMMSNVKTHRIYSSKFSLKVVELNHTELATFEDKHYKIDRWARLFKSTTWEELKMCAGNDEAMKSVVNIMYEYNEEEAVRDMCRARAEAVAFEAFIKEEKERLQGELEELEAEMEQAKAEKVQTEEALEQAKAEKVQTEEALEQAKAEKVQTEEALEQTKAEKAQIEVENEKLKAELEYLKQKYMK